MPSCGGFIGPPGKRLAFRFVPVNYLPHQTRHRKTARVNPPATMPPGWHGDKLARRAAVYAQLQPWLGSGGALKTREEFAVFLLSRGPIRTGDKPRQSAFSRCRTDGSAIKILIFNK